MPILTSDTKRHLTQDQQSYLLETVLQPAIDAWSGVISLIRVQGNLTLDRNQLWDGVSCGPGLDSSGTPSALVPEEHFDDYIPIDTASSTNGTREGGTGGGGGNDIGKGVANADLVIYIEVGFRQTQTETESNDNNNDNDKNDEDHEGKSGSSNYNHHPGTIRGSDRKYKDAGFESLPTKELEGMSSSNGRPPSAFKSSAALSTASGSLNATHPSLIGIVGSEMSASLAAAASRPTKEVEHPKCSPAYLASATHCSTDQFDRPTHGMIHFCVDPQTFFTSKSDDVRHLQLTRLTAMHELGHVVGFNLQSLAHFRERDGTPRTPRGPVAGVNGTSATEPWVVGDVPDVKVECTGILPPGNGKNRKKSRKRAVIPLPSESTLRFRTIRGGVRVADVVLPTVRAVVRNHFACDNLYGAELEGDPYLVERQQDPLLIATVNREPGADQGKMRRTEQLGDSDEDDDSRDRRGDYDYLEQHGVTADQDAISDILDQDIQYYNDDKDVGSCIEDHWVSTNLFPGKSANHTDLCCVPFSTSTT